MNIINIKLGIDTQPCSAITLGRRGENEVTQVVVDFSSWVEEFGAGVITLLAMRSRDSSAYPIVLTLDGSTATWDVTSTDTAFKGSGRAEFIYTVGEQIAKSVVFNTVVMQDIGEPSETPPDPYEDWLERLTELGAETQANAEAAQQSAENAAQSAEDAAQSATSAEGYAGQAETAAGLAQDAQTASEAARDAAQTAQASAESYATAASGSADSAAGSASDASASASAASDSATAAGDAETQAESAKTAAQAAQSAAEDAAEDAQQAAQQAHVEYEQLSDEVDDLSDEVAQQKSAIEALDALVDRKAGMLVDSASGAIASFVPDATVPNLLGLTVDIEPVQDLHGYDAPWPGGGGKNKLKNNLTSGEINGVTATVDADGVISFSGTTNAITVFNINVDIDTEFAKNTNYVLSGCTGGDFYTYRLEIYKRVGNNAVNYNGDTQFQLLDTDSGCVCRIVVQSGINMSGVKIYPMIRLASETDATFAPYENLCPISGWDSVEVEATGINVWDEEWERYGSAQIKSKTRFFIQPGTYYVKTPVALSLYKFPDLTSANTGSIYVPRNGGVITVPEGTYYLMLYTETGYGTIYNNDISINYPSTDHDYHPYAGNRYTIQLGQTVYGGTLTIAEDGGVTALVDRAMVDLGTLSWVKDVAPYMTYRTTLNAMLFQSLPLCSSYKGAIVSDLANVQNGEIASTNSQTLNLVRIRDDQKWQTMDASAFRESVSNVQLVYYLAESITIQLDPAIIATIANQTNNVWADAGDVSVEFAADLKTYIDSKIAAAVAAMS